MRRRCSWPSARATAATAAKSGRAGEVDTEPARDHSSRGLLWRRRADRSRNAGCGGRPDAEHGTPEGGDRPCAAPSREGRRRGRRNCPGPAGTLRAGAQQQPFRRSLDDKGNARAPRLRQGIGGGLMPMHGTKPGQGTLVIIGGGEDKEGDRVILREVARRLDGGKLVLATVASHEPEGYFEAYQKAFADLGVKDLVELYVKDRAETLDPEKLRTLDGAAGVFFSGGDQLRISSQIGDTPIEQRVREIHEHGGLIAGTSAGASMMSETMLVKGTSGESYKIGDLHMAPGLGLVRNAIIDQHFAERGRFGRLLGAVAHNPRELGIGIDEDTALVVEGSRFEVIGSGCVYVVDGAGITHSNIAEARPERALSMYDIRLHVLSSGDEFDLSKRKPAEVPDLQTSHAIEAEVSA